MNIRLILSSLAIISSTKAFSDTAHGSAVSSYHESRYTDIIEHPHARTLDENSENIRRRAGDAGKVVNDDTEKDSDVIKQLKEQITKLQNELNDYKSKYAQYKIDKENLDKQIKLEEIKKKFQEDIFALEERNLDRKKREIEELLKQVPPKEDDSFMGKIRSGFKEAYTEHPVLFYTDAILLIFTVALFLYKKFCMGKSQVLYDDLSISDRPIISKTTPSIVDSRSIEKDLTSIVSETRSKPIKAGKSSSGVLLETSDVKIEANNNGSRKTFEKTTEVINDDNSKSFNKSVSLKQKMPLPTADSTVPPTVPASAQIQNL